MIPQAAALDADEHVLAILNPILLNPATSRDLLLEPGRIVMAFALTAHAG